ncbi:MAG: hypothetical protein DMF94_22480 [Acidobacteria bacterium]|nr:MAG: hypothetical protein DMF94_22480 [Acidobacteriota bacterium]
MAVQSVGGRVAEIAEFAYATDTRLFVTSPSTRAAHRAVSVGQLWTTRGGMVPADMVCFPTWRACVL